MVELLYAVKQTGQVIKICQNDFLYPKLKDANEKLLQVKIELAKHLEIKRSQLPILYLLNNVDLLNIYAKS